MKAGVMGMSESQRNTLRAKTTKVHDEALLLGKLMERMLEFLRAPVPQPTAESKPAAAQQLR